MYSNNLTALKYLLHEESMLRIDIIQNVGKILEEDSNDKGFRNGGYLCRWVKCRKSSS